MPGPILPSSSVSALRVEPDLQAGSASQTGPGFGDVIRSFVGQVDATQHRADAMVEALAVGEPVDVHKVMLALNEASNALQLTLQVRSHILDAYQEIMRTQV